MVQLMSYGLTGLTAMLVMATCCACGDELPPTQQQSSYDMIDKAHVNDSSTIKPETCLQSDRGQVEVFRD
jgi:hypothetical protein